MKSQSATTATGSTYFWGEFVRVVVSELQAAFLPAKILQFVRTVRARCMRPSVLGGSRY